MIKSLVDFDHLPDYQVSFEDDLVTFTNRQTMTLPKQDSKEFPKLNPETYTDAKQAAPGYDVYYLEREWQGFWFNSGKPTLRNPDKTFISFCKKRHEMKPNP